MDAVDRHRRILVADDHLRAAQAMAWGLQDEWGLHCQVDVAQDGQQAIDLACVNRPAAAILDIEMPHVNGIEAAMAIRAAYPDDPPKLIAVTGGVRSFIDAEQSLAFDHVVMKPVTIADLKKLLEGSTPVDAMVTEGSFGAAAVAASTGDNRRRHATGR